MLLSFSGVALAGDANNSVINGLAGKIPFTKQAMKRTGGMMKNKGHFKADGQKELLATLDGLVKDGTITQGKVDEIKAYVAKKTKEMETLRQELKNLSPEERKALHKKRLDKKPGTRSEGRPDLFKELVENKILSQAQADTITTKIRETAQKQHQQRIADGLKTLVEKGTITQEQANKIIKQMETAPKEREALFEKTKDMTPEERHQYMEKNRGELQNPLSQLVTDGTITQDQAKAIGKVLSKHKGYKAGHKGGFKGSLGPAGNKH